MDEIRQTASAATPDAGNNRPDIAKLSAEEVEKLLDERLKHKQLHAEGLVKRYGRRTVADHVSFDVKQGEIVGLLGPNGEIGRAHV